MAFDHNDLLAAAKRVGFVHVPNKGGIVERTVIKRGEPVKLTLLTSKRDASLLVKHSGGAPFKFHFRRNYVGAADFIHDYVGDSK